jgi:DNA polymerase III subunit alpha
MSDFVHLHCHSHYSLMDGLNTPYELLEAAKNQGQTSLAITDHGSLAAHRDMQIAAKQLGIKPILGLEAYISPTDRFDKRSVSKREDNVSLYNHIILLAKNDQGLKNLQKLSQIAWTEGYYHKPRIDMEVLWEFGNGIIVVSGCMNGLISKAIERGEIDKAKDLVKTFKARFKEDFYIEVQSHNPQELNAKLFELADEFGVKPVATGDCHFAKKEERDLEELLLILSTKPTQNKEADYTSGRQRSSILDRFDHIYPNRPISFADINVYIQSYSEIKSDFEKAGVKRKDIYQSSVEIADKIEAYDFHENLDLLPVPKKNALKTLKEMCTKSLVEKRLIDNDKYTERVKEELKIIEDKNFASYFLVVSDMVNWAKQNEILVGPGRGSAAGSLVCYLLGITEVDPIEFDLLFFRFINPERNDFPDIDTDFMDRRRGEVKEYLRKKFKHVASISTYQYFKDKGVIRDVARTFLVPLGEVDKALKGVETFEEYESNPSTEEFRKKYPEVTKYASMLRGKIRGNGMHAAGVVVAKDDISKYVPIETRKDPNESVSGRIPVVAYDMEQTADLGLIKLDVLGLKTLSVIDDTLRTIEHIKKKKIDIKSIKLDDPKVFEMLSNGFTKGVFQAEATPYTNLLMKMGVSTFEDLAASNALVRPGAMNTVGGSYIRRKKGEEMITYAHPIMQQFTARTYGVIIYQEQVMQACVYLGGMSWADADKVRKIIGKKKDASEFDAYKDQFITGASLYITPEDAQKLWHDFEAHAGYSFNRSHAIAYSMLSYYTAWLKCYYPLEFMFAILKNEKDKDARTDYLLEAKRLGIKVLLPHINESDLDFTIQGNSIRFGLSNIKYISDNIGSKITALRPFKTYEGFTEKAKEKGSGINARAIESLNMIGAAAFPDNPRQGNENENLYEYLGIPKFDTGKLSPKIKSQVNPLSEFLESGCFVLLAMVKSIKKGTGWSRVELVDDTGSVGIFHSENTQIETGMMYFFLVGDNRIHKYVTINDVVDKVDDPFVQWLYRDKLKIEDGKRLVLDFTNYKTKANKMMAHIILSDSDKNLERVIAFPKVYTTALGKMRPGTVCDPAISKMDDGTLFVKEVTI